MILALVYIVAISLVVGALASWVMNDLNNTVHFQTASDRTYAATAAADIAIADIRYAPYQTQTPPNTTGNCWTPAAPNNTTGSPAIDGYTMAVWCNTFQNSTTLLTRSTRTVSFYVCQESTLDLPSPSASATQCSSSPLLFVKVVYDDYPQGEVTGYLTSVCTDTCGEQATVDAWIWGGSAGSGSSGPGAASKVAFTTEPPATATTGATLASFAVSVEDANGNVETTGYTGASDAIALTASIGCTLGGTDTATASNGVATFSGVTITAGSSCTLTATDSTRTLATATSSPATTVTSPTPTKVVFTVEPPATTTAGAALTSFAVSVENASGNVITSGTGATDTIALTSSCTLGGTVSVAAVGGVATFKTTTINKGTSCTLTATDSSRTLTTATSAPATTVTPTTPAQIAWTPTPTSPATSGSTMASFAVSIEDTYGNVETAGNTGATDVITLTTTSPNCSLSGTLTATGSGGVATFNGAKVTRTFSGSCTITATDSTRSLTAITNAINVNG